MKTPNWKTADEEEIWKYVAWHLAENGIEGAEAARAVMGDRLQVQSLPVVAFQIFASQDGLPPVIVLSVAVRLQDESGKTYTLVLMA